jgi:carbamoyl-phosphate synthase large subunit
MYSTYDDECERREPRRADAASAKVIILGGGPNRIGQGIEFDYCCVPRRFALRDAGFETIMVNCNPETVSTDYDTSDRLYFEPLTLEDVLEIIDAERERPCGRDRAVRRPDAAQARARAEEGAGVPILGTSPDAIDLAEDRERFSSCSTSSGSRSPERHARSREEAREVAERDRLPGRGAAVLRARRPRHGDRLRRAAALDRYMRDAVERRPSTRC